MTHYASQSLLSAQNDDYARKYLARTLTDDILYFACGKICARKSHHNFLSPSDEVPREEHNSNFPIRPFERPEIDRVSKKDVRK